MHAQNWSVGISTGPFVFGDFVERTFRVGNQVPGSTIKTQLSASTRAGAAVDLERRLADRWALRAVGTFTRAPLAVGGDDGVALEAGDIEVTTIALPLVFRINPRGSLRFHLFGGPAYAAYSITARTNAPRSIPVFRGTRTEWGFEAGGGASWQWSERFAVEGQISDIVTSSPFREEEFPNAPGIDIPKPHNVHSTIGVRYRF